VGFGMGCLVRVSRQDEVNRGRIWVGLGGSSRGPTTEAGGDEL